MIDTLAPGATVPPAEPEAPKESRPVRRIMIAPGSTATPCDLARAFFKSTEPATCTDLIYFSEKSEKTGKRQPVSMRHPAALYPTGTTWGQGLSHFADCPDAARFRKPK